MKKKINFIITNAIINVTTSEGKVSCLRKFQNFFIYFFDFLNKVTPPAGKTGIFKLLLPASFVKSPAFFFGIFF